MQLGSRFVLHAQHEVWSLLLGSSVKRDDIQMSANGTLLRLGEVVLLPANLHVARGHHAGMPGAFSQTVLHLSIKNTKELNTCYDLWLY